MYRVNSTNGWMSSADGLGYRSTGTIPRLGLAEANKTQALITMLVERDCREIE
jgi:hypothetical protein